MRKKVFFLLLASCLAAAAGCAGQGAAPDDAATVSPGGEAEPTTVQGKQEIPYENNSDKENQNDSVPNHTDQNNKKEVYQAVPYRLFPTSQNAWVGDVMPMTDKDTMQLYYLYETDYNGVGYHPIHKFSTKNFYEYSDDGLVLPYGSSRDDADLAIGTGSVLIAQDGKYHLFYTGHNDGFPEKFHKIRFMPRTIIREMILEILLFFGTRKNNAIGS